MCLGRWLTCIGTLLLLTACGSGEPTVAPTATLNPQASQGKQLFSQHCATCHATDPDTVILGPSLAGIARRAAGRVPDLTARAYVEESILQPGAYVVSGFDDAMPTNFGKRLSGEEMDALIAYLLTLDGNVP